MPVLDNVTQDDPLLFEGIASFDGGMDTKTQPRQLAMNQCVDMLNIDTDNDNSATTRKGTENWGTFPATPTGTWPICGMAFFNTNDRTDLIVARNGYLYAQNAQTNNVAWTRVNFASSSFTFTNTNDPVYFTMLEGKMFFCDGINVLRYIEPLGGTASGLVVRDCPAQSFGSGATLTTLPAPQRFVYLTTHLGRVFAVDKLYPDTLRVSSALSASSSSSWNSVDSIGLSGLKAISDGDAITGICSWTGTRLVVFKRHSTFVIQCDGDTSEWIVQNIDENIGCASHKSIARAGSDIFWLSDSGVRTLVRTLAGSENQISEPLSKPITQLISKIYLAQIESSAACFYENRYILTVPSLPDGSTRFTMVYNTVYRSWTGRWTGMDALHYVRYTNDSIDSLFLGMSNGFIRRWLGGKKASFDTESDYLDAGQSYSSSITTREYTFSDYLTKKTPFSVEAEFIDSDADVSISFIKDSGSRINIVTDFPTIVNSLTIPFTLDSNALLPSSLSVRAGSSMLGTSQFKGIKFIISASSGKMNLVSFAFSAYMDTYVPVGTV
jgi:hypothetical protein